MAGCVCAGWQGLWAPVQSAHTGHVDASRRLQTIAISPNCCIIRKRLASRTSRIMGADHIVVTQINDLQ